MAVLDNPERLLRLVDANYADGLSSPVDGRSAVDLAMNMFNQDASAPDPEGLSAMFIFWGQFIDHDLDLSRSNSGEFLQIPGMMMPLERSAFDETTGIDGPREQVNEITAQMDASMFYGSSDHREGDVRSFSGGRLTVSEDPTSDRGLLPLASADQEMDGNTDPDNPVFLAGDIRANENNSLTSLHTLFVREHNHWADRLGSENPEWTDEQIFQAARSIVEVEIQNITYRDWLPNMIGGAFNAADAALLDPSNGAISTEFSTAAFRFGHTMVPNEVERLNEDGTSIGALSVQEQFFNPKPIMEDGIAELLRGNAATHAEAFDTQVVDGLNALAPAGPGLVAGFSLPVFNIMRGRDHGLSSWLDTRAAVVGDLDPAAIDLSDFALVTSNTAVQAQLAAAYGTVDQIDLWVGGLAEDAIPGTQMGVTFTAILADQFSRTRSADATFGQLDPLVDPSIAEEVAGTSLTDIIQRNSSVEVVQQDVFQAMARVCGTDDADRMLGTRDADLVMGLAGNDTLFGRRGDDEIIGEEGNDRMAGGRGDDHLMGGLGDDNLRGQWGNDTIEGGAGNDVIIENQGTNLLDGGAGNDRIHGGSGNDTILGGAGDDRARGRDGDDIIDMGAGNDRVVGDAGADTFVFATGNEIDTIMDFQSGEDRVDLTNAAVADFAELTALASEGRNRVTFEIGDDTLVLRKVALADLHEADFLFG
ncbi:MAG: peroxidase family protein [Pseudomonadota bacterium]